MATYDVCDTEIRPTPAPAGLFAPVLQAWTRIQAHMDERRAIHHLYRLDARMLRDMGFDPRAIYAAHEGAISEWKTRRCAED